LQSSYLPRLPPERWAGLSRYFNPDYGKAANVFELETASVVYVMDVPGPVTHEQRVFDDRLAPQWSLAICAGKSTINYGPWVNRQRALLHRFFFPFDYENRGPHKPVVGSAREFSHFKVTIEFEHDVSMRIPFQAFSLGGETVQTSHIELQAAAGTKLEYRLPWATASEVEKEEEEEEEEEGKMIEEEERIIYFNLHFFLYHLSAQGRLRHFD
jgi:hypothetical protein